MPNLSSIQAAPVVGVEITSLSILMEVATALGASTADVAHVAGLLKGGKLKVTPNPISQTTYMTMEHSAWEEIQPFISPQSLLTGSEALTSLSKKLYTYYVDGTLQENNSSSPSMTQQENSDSYKPVTLTLTGKLKPNTLTKVARKKSSPSSKLQGILGNSTWIAHTGGTWTDTL